jgi:hypothetical protein
LKTLDDQGDQSETQAFDPPHGYKKDKNKGSKHPLMMMMMMMMIKRGRNENQAFDPTLPWWYEKEKQRVKTTPTL